MLQTVVGWLRSRGFPLTFLIAALVALLGGLAGDVDLRLPFINRVLPLPVILILLAAVVVVTPLQDRFGGLERTTARGRFDRLLAAMLVGLTVILACLPAAATAGPRFSWCLLLTLLAGAVLAVVVLGPSAWLVPTASVMIITYVDFTQGDVIRHALETVGSPTLSVTLFMAMWIFVSFGPGPMRRIDLQ